MTVLRELEEETGIKGSNPTLIDVKGKPDRDPRYHMISFFYLVKYEGGDLKAGDDAATADWYFLDEVIKRKDDFAFDHHEVLEKNMAKIEAHF